MMQIVKHRVAPFRKKIVSGVVDLSRRDFQKQAEYDFVSSEPQQFQQWPLHQVVYEQEFDRVGVRVAECKWLSVLVMMSMHVLVEPLVTMKDSMKIEDDDFVAKVFIQQPFDEAEQQLKETWLEYYEGLGEWHVRENETHQYVLESNTVQ